MSGSAITFATDRRVHIGLAASSVDRSVEFYRELFNTAPTKTRPGYARFEVSDPPLNLSLVGTDQARGPADVISHFGIQVKSTSAVSAMQRRLESAGLVTTIEKSVSCCYAVQDKIWLVDPDGHRWEVFVVLDDAPDTGHSDDRQCCPTAEVEICCLPGGEPCCSESE